MSAHNNYLMHYGIKGQQWGVRRFQNPDGTLTAEGKARYYDTLDRSQKDLYNRLSFNDQKKLNRKLAEGKNWETALKETTREAAIKGAAITLAALYIHPYTRPVINSILKSAGKVTLRGISKVATSDTVRKGVLWIKKMMNRHAMKKAGAVVVNSKDYKIFSGLLG